ncbi:hypothetical protein AGIG_G14720 [Arapaima gigas]
MHYSGKGTLTGFADHEIIEESLPQRPYQLSASSHAPLTVSEEERFHEHTCLTHCCPQPAVFITHPTPPAQLEAKKNDAKKAHSRRAPPPAARSRRPGHPVGDGVQCGDNRKTHTRHLSHSADVRHAHRGSKTRYEDICYVPANAFGTSSSDKCRKVQNRPANTLLRIMTSAK